MKLSISNIHSYKIINSSESSEFSEYNKPKTNYISYIKNIKLDSHKISINLNNNFTIFYYLFINNLNNLNK